MRGCVWESGREGKLKMVPLQALAILDFPWKAISPCGQCNDATFIHKLIHLARSPHFVDKETEVGEVK